MIWNSLVTGLRRAILISALNTILKGQKERLQTDPRWWDNLNPAGWDAANPRMVSGLQSADSLTLCSPQEPVLRRKASRRGCLTDGTKTCLLWWEKTLPKPGVSQYFFSFIFFPQNFSVWVHSKSFNTSTAAYKLSKERRFFFCKHKRFCKQLWEAIHIYIYRVSFNQVICRHNMSIKGSLSSFLHLS